MNIATAFSFPFEDPDWTRKVLIASLIALIPILGQIFILGWMLDITRRVIRRDSTPLPEIDFGRQLVDGLKAMLIGLGYSLPIFLMMAPPMYVALTAEQGSLDGNTPNSMILIVSTCCYGLIGLYGLLLGFAAPAGMANFAVKDRISAAFNVQEVSALLKAAPGAFIMVLLGGLVANGIIAPLGLIACGIGALITYTYAMAINGHLYGQAYNEATQNRGYAQEYDPNFR